MLFNSFAFLAFFVAVFICYWAFSGKQKVQNFVLLLASYGFYAAWDYRFLSLIIGSTLLDFYLGKKISLATDPRTRKKLLRYSLMGNLGTLGVFKYFDFFLSSLGDLLVFPMDDYRLGIVLPVGISFYTFQSMSYTIDIYRSKLTPSDNFLDFALYISFFPQLVAGPIERASSLLPQLKTSRKLNAEDVYLGLYLIVYGLFKKVVIADNLAISVERIFDPTSPGRGLDVWLGLLAFTFQIYCDFSGYSSIARGTARLLGIRLRLNFNLPYFALTPSDFWRRWHISLSEWLRDYLYISLGGNRVASTLVYRNLLLTMMLGGLWHGAAWHFVWWGVFHGLLLGIYRLAGIEAAKNLLIRCLQWLSMFFFTMLGWLLFRAETVELAWRLLARASLELSGMSRSFGFELFLYIVPLLLVEIWQHRKGDLLVLPRSGIFFAALGQSFFLTMILIFGVREGGEFLYFQF